MTDGRLDGIYDGTVVDNADPLGLGRVRFSIPGLIDPQSGWAEPIGAGGSKRRGRFDVPEVGATVTCQFLMGDPDRPKYQVAYYGTGEVPSYAAGVDKKSASLVKVYETEMFELVVDDRGDKKFMHIKAKASGTEFLLGDDGTVTITAARINFGDATAQQPFVLGTLWKTMMTQLFQFLMTHTHITNVGPSAPSVELQTGLPTIQLDPLLSKVAFASK